LFGQGHYIYNYLRYDDDQEALQRLQVFELGEDHLLIRRLFAESARFAAGAWVASGGWARSFAGLESSFSQFDGPRIIDYPEPPTYFESEVKQPEQMSYRELERYLEELRESGQEAPEIEVELHSKLAFPLISLVMALVALPFAFRLGRRGALYGIGLALVLGMVFLGVYAFFRTLGETAALPPLLAVWSPNILFTLYSLYLFLGIRT
jgi:lipopolysaccharide export LptBFGC system permease protein LptF